MEKGLPIPMESKRMATLQGMRKAILPVRILKMPNRPPSTNILRKRAIPMGIPRKKAIPMARARGRLPNGPNR